MSQSIKLPKLLQEGCVLQRGEKQEFGDGTNHRQSLRLHFRKKVYRTKCDAEGTFETEISCEKNRWSLCVEHKKVKMDRRQS